MATKLIKDVELAQVTGIPVPTIRADRFNERRLPFIKLGRSVLYDPDEVFRVLKQQFTVGGPEIVTPQDQPRATLKVRRLSTRQRG